MQTHSIVAEQTNRKRYEGPDPTVSREIELTVRLEFPDEDGADVGISSRFDSSLPPEWDDALHQRLYQGVHGGLANFEAPLPVGGIGVHITHFRFLPPLESNANARDVQWLGDALEALAAATVTSLWNGIISLGASSAP